MEMEDREESWRKDNFLIGTVHSNLNVDKRSKENKLRNDLFLIGMLRLFYSRNNYHYIRLVSYEMPLKSVQPRDKCIDLLGYDRDKTPWIIELKSSDSSEKIEEVIQQINGYEKDFKKVRPCVEKEIRDKYLWPDFTFSDEIGKIILVHRTYYERNPIKKYRDCDIKFCSFAKIKDVEKDGVIDLVNRDWENGIVTLEVKNN